MIKALLSVQTLDRYETSFAYSEDGAVVSVSISSGNRMHPELRLFAKKLIKVIQQNECNKRGIQHKTDRYFLLL